MSKWSNYELVTVFADASLSGDRVGCGWWFKSSSATGFGSDTLVQPNLNSNEAELWGLYVAIKAAVQAHNTPVDLVVQCDNIGALQALHTAGHRWAKTSTLKAGHRKKMSDFERSILKKVRELSYIKKVWLKHIKGHTGRSDPRSHINHRTDRLAAAARNQITSTL